MIRILIVFFSAICFSLALFGEEQSTNIVSKSSKTVIEQQKSEPAIPVETQYLRVIKPSTSFFNGKIAAVKNATYRSPEAGILKYTTTPGNIVFAEIKNEKGEVVRKGTPIFIMDDTLPKLAVETTQNSLEEAERILENKKTEYERYERLNRKQKNLIAQAKIEKAKTDYDTAFLKVKKCEFEHKKAQTNLDRCVAYSDFTGQVDQVYYSPGTAVDKFKDIVEVTMMNPIAVKMTLPLGLINHLEVNNNILVYDQDTREPVQALLCKNPINPSDMELLIPNMLIPASPITEEQKKLPVINKILFASHAYITKKSFDDNSDLTKKAPITVPDDSIRKDNNGYYVWIGIGQRFFEKNKPLKKQFKVQKVYIIPGDIVRYVSYVKGFGSNFRSIEETDKIKAGDLIVVDAPSTLKDGDEIVYQQLHWRFTVNEKVKVTISGINDPGFYVPFNTIFNLYLGTPQVCVVREGIAVFVDVQQTGYHGEYIRIESKDLREGDQIVLDINRALQNVYEGAPLKVVKAVEPLIKLSHNVAKAYKPVTDPVE